MVSKPVDWLRASEDPTWWHAFPRDDVDVQESVTAALCGFSAAPQCLDDTPPGSAADLCLTCFVTFGEEQPDQLRWATG